jgi:hypothetical protein
MKFLDREGDGPAAQYSNTPEGALFLDQASPRYIGGILIMLNARLFKFWNDLPEALRTGKAQNESKHGQKGMFEELYADLARLEQFMGAMTGLSRANFEAFAEKFDFSDFRTLCDVGGATGLSIVAAKNSALLRPSQVAPIANHRAAGLGAWARHRATSSKTAAQGGRDHDGMILHDWNLEKKMHLIRSATRPSSAGAFAIEAHIDDERRKNAFGLLMSLNMLIEFGEAFDYSGADFRGWCAEVGFRRFDQVHLAGPASAAIAYK